MQKDLVEIYPILGSSHNPEEIKLRIKAGGLMIIPMIIAMARLFDFELVENDLVMLTNSIAFVASYSVFLYGVIRAKIKK